MIQALQRGQRLPLSSVTTQARLTLRVHLPGIQSADLSVFGLNEARLLSDDRYFIFYNQPSSPEGAITLDLNSQSFQIDLERVPLGIHRLLLAATSDQQTFRELQRGTVSLEDAQRQGAHFEVQGSMFESEQAVMLLELYRHQGSWRVMGVGQGFNGGLQALLESLGGEVAAVVVPEVGAPTPPLAPTWKPLETAQIDAQPYAGTCRHCGKNPSLFNRLNAQGLCKDCARAVNDGLQHFRTRFLAACADGVMELHEWEDLQKSIVRGKLDAHVALEFVRPDALHLLERTLTLARADGEISDAEVEGFDRLAKLLEMPQSLMGKLRTDLDDLRAATQIRQGHLPTISSSLILEAGEVAHLEVQAQYRHVTASRSRDIPGRLVITNRQIHFVSAEGGWNVQYGKVLRIEEVADGVNLELGVKKGTGLYHGVAKSVVLSATLDALVRLHKRLLLMPQTEKASRGIPQKVKLEVWQRDQGKCVQCGDSNYLEYDHIIPFSLGGASTEGNLQLLCRRCNLQKSNRI